MTKIVLSDDQRVDAERMASTPDLPNFSLPGTGKTHTTLEAMRLSGHQRHLIVAPKIAVGWWEQQAREYLGADVTVLKTGSTPPSGDIVVATYDIARNAEAMLDDYFLKGASSTLTLDESHYVCNPDAARTQSLLGPDGLVRHFATCWCLSGSPKQNHANDYWTQAGVLHPDIWASHGIANYDEFCKRYTRVAERQYHPRMRPEWKIVGSRNEEELGRIIYQELGAIRRTTSEGMPKLRYRELPVKVTIPRDIRAAMRELTASEIIAQLNDPNSIMAKVWRIVGMAKVPTVVPYVGEIAQTGPVLLGCWHRDVMAAYDDALTAMGLRTMLVHGSTPNNAREPIRQAFNEGKIDVLIGQMKAMGVSWNLQEASSHVIIAEEHPSPSVIEQFYKRVYRRGQARDCVVDIILGQDMIVDEVLNNVRKQKEASNDKIIA